VKKWLNILWKITGTAIFLIGIGIFISRVINIVPSAELSKKEQVISILEEGGCFVCHGGPDYCTHLHWPVIGRMISKNAEKGIRYASATSILEHFHNNRIIDEALLIKGQKVIAERSMPPVIYRIIHWKSLITKDKQRLLLRWIYEYMASDHGWPMPTQERPFEPVRPLPDSLPADLAKVNLGRILYHDPRLSADSTVSCATCHNPETAGVDNLDYSVGTDGLLGMYSTLTTYNAVFHPFFFWDGRASSLPQLSVLMLTDPVTMGNESFVDVVQRLEADLDFKSLFTESYPEGYSAESISDALAQYHKVLITPDAPFDKYLQGDSDAIGPEAKKGYRLFKRLGCASCHNSVGIGGNSIEYMGLSNDFFSVRDSIRLPDLGRYRVTAKREDIHKFKVPGLRNIELTYPYFHNASAPDLKTAVEAMAFHQKNKQLNKRKVQQIISFLHTLTGTFREKSPAVSEGQ